MVLILDYKKNSSGSMLSDSDVFYLLDYLSDGKTVGRSRISTYLGIGEGSTRSLLNILLDYDLVKIRQRGVSLNRNGTEFLSALGMRAVCMSVPTFVLGRYQQGVVISEASEKVFNGIDQRNAGIRAGGDGCTTWVMEDGRLIMLPNWDMDVHKPKVSENIRKLTSMMDGDVLIVGGGETKHVAMAAAGDAALQLIRCRAHCHPIKWMPTHARTPGSQSWKIIDVLCFLNRPDHIEHRKAQRGRYLDASLPRFITGQHPLPLDLRSILLDQFLEEHPWDLVPPVGFAIGATGRPSDLPGYPIVVTHVASALQHRFVPGI